MLVLLDRDGVLNRDRHDSVTTPENLEILPGAPEALALFARAGWHVAIVTNQSIVGRGIISEAMLERIHLLLRTRLTALGGTIDHIFTCTDAPDAATWRRKPKPGMLQEALALFGVEAARTPMVGDALTDLEAAAAAGCPRYLVRTGKGAQIDAGRLPASLQPVTVCLDILDAAHRIVSDFRA